MSLSSRSRAVELLPEMALFEVPETAPAIRNLATAVNQTLDEQGLFKTIRAGMTVGVAVGSRGIDRIDTVVGHVVQRILGADARPVLIPAMGSHGAATGAGQARVLERLLPQAGSGIPIDTRVETQCVRCGSAERSYFVSTAAMGVDALITVSRVRPHTMFSGSIESGLCKMLVVGLGKFEGARSFHEAALEVPYEEFLVAGTQLLAAQYPLLGGVAVVENNAGKIAKIEAVRASDFVGADRRLLEDARELMPQLPFDDWDLLIVEEVGKDVSGTGMDTNVIRRKPNGPQSKGKILAVGLSRLTAGNAYGLGYADATTDSVVGAIDPETAEANASASGNRRATRIPRAYASEQDAFAALQRGSDRETAIIQIRNTKDIGQIGLSRRAAQQIDSSSNIRQTTPWRAVSFDRDGRIERLSVKK